MQLRSFFLSLCLFFTSAFSLDAEGRLTGLDIKNQAMKVQTPDDLPLKLFVSDRRTFFPCSGKLEFQPRRNNDWSTVEVLCPAENWRTVLRTSYSEINNETVSNIDNDQVNKVLILNKNIKQGEIIMSDDLAYSQRAADQRLGSFNDVEDVIGRKALFNLSRGIVIKSRHLSISYPVEKGNQVLITASNSNIEITVSAIALEDGQIGDMIKVKNARSKKIINAVVIDEKKVSPLTNM
jgi:flagella basal body P-ring formation protein FlgA